MCEWRGVSMIGFVNSHCCSGGVRCAWLRHRARCRAGSHQCICCDQALTTFMCPLRSTKAHVCRLIPMQYVHVIWLNLQRLCVLWDHKHTYAVEYTIQHLYVILLHNLTFMFGQVGSPGLDTDNHTETSGVLTCFRVPTCFCVSVGSLQSYYTCLVYENIYSICISYKDTCSMYMQFTTNHDVYMSLNNTWCSK